MSAKQSAIEAISRLPDDADFRDVAEEVAFLAAVGQSESDIDADRTLSNDEMKDRISKWIAS